MMFLSEGEKQSQPQGNKDLSSNPQSPHTNLGMVTLSVADTEASRGLLATSFNPGSERHPVSVHLSGVG